MRNSAPGPAGVDQLGQAIADCDRQGRDPIHGILVLPVEAGGRDRILTDELQVRDAMLARDLLQQLADLHGHAGIGRAAFLRQLRGSGERQRHHRHIGEMLGAQIGVPRGFQREIGGQDRLDGVILGGLRTCHELAGSWSIVPRAGLQGR